MIPRVRALRLQTTIFNIQIMWWMMKRYPIYTKKEMRITS